MTLRATSATTLRATTETTSPATTPTSRRRPGLRRAGAILPVGALLLAPLLSSCGGNASASGQTTLNYYSFPDNSGAIQQAVDECTKASGGKYRIVYNKLPSDADGQRQQMVRRLAAHDTSLDILALDVTWAPEFAEAGWVREWTGANKAAAENGTLKVPLQTATWQGKLYAVPYNTNTQLLWYRSDLAPTPPKTWDEMLNMSAQLAKAGKPHYVEIQGAQYEGATVWFNTLVASAGGSILNASATAPSLGPPALKALEIMKRLATGPAGDPSLSNQQEDQNRLAMESGNAAFELNYPFVYASMQSDNPQLAKVFKWTRYPTVKPGEPSHVTIGGINLAVSAYSTHPTESFAAALCLRDKPHQVIAAVKGGLPPTIQDLYLHPTPDFIKQYPFYKEVYASLQTASVRPLTPAYQSLSTVISHSVSPPANINPQSTLSSLTTQIKDALQFKGLIP